MWKRHFGPGNIKANVITPKVQRSKDAAREAAAKDIEQEPTESTEEERLRPKCARTLGSLVIENLSFVICFAALGLCRFAFKSASGSGGGGVRSSTALKTTAARRARRRLRRGEGGCSCGPENASERWANSCSRARVDHISTRGKNRLGEKTRNF